MSETHRCGQQGFDPMLGDTCLACERRMSKTTTRLTPLVWGNPSGFPDYGESLAYLFPEDVEGMVCALYDLGFAAGRDDIARAYAEWSEEENSAQWLRPSGSMVSLVSYLIREGYLTTEDEG